MISNCILWLIGFVYRFLATGNTVLEWLSAIHTVLILAIGLLPRKVL